MAIKAEPQKSLRARWDQIDQINEKTTIKKNCEKYAAWTLPYLFPQDNLTKSAELPVEIDSIGAQGVNHLANRIISTLFPAKSLFFRLRIDQEMRDMMEAAMAQAGMGSSPDQIKAELETALQEAQEQLTKAENRAADRLNMVQFRPQAINAMKLLIVTGNALVYHPDDDSPVQVYSIRNYSVVRDCSGEVVEIMTRESRAFETFNTEVQNALKADDSYKQLYAHNKVNGKTHAKGYNDATEVTIYTQIILEDDGKYHVYQHADDIPLPTRATYTKSSLRWIPLVWNLIQGEDYGRGLVADFGGAFHALQVLNSSLLNTAAIMGDIKFFVKPTSMVDVEAVQNSLPGSYHVGNPDDIGTALINLGNNYQILQTGVDRFQRQIAQAFMLTQALTRDAERVTATEITRDVDELEASNAGVYSRYASGWQQHLARMLLNDIGFDGVGDGIEPDVITGMDNLSRAGEAQNMRMFLADLGMLNTVPEDIRQGIKTNRFIKSMGDLHQVEYSAWIMTDEELQAVRQQQAMEQQQLMQQQGEQQAQIEAAKSAG